MDIIFSLIGLIFLLPLTFIVYVNNLKNGDRGSVFFIDERIGKDGKIFKMYKFRSMVVGAEEKLKELLEKDEAAREEYSTYKKLKKDPRITKDGEFIAEYSSAAEAQKQTGIQRTVIGLVCKGKGKTAGGYVWKYKYASHY